MENWKAAGIRSTYLDYEVSDLGGVRSIKARSGPRGAHLVGQVRTINPQRSANGRYKIRCQGANIMVHALVATAFHGPKPPGTECAHLDGNCTNNVAPNLEWVTHTENQRHRKLHGTSPAGSKNSSAKLTDSMVAEIRSNRLPTRHYSGLFGVSMSAVQRIRKGSTWRAQSGF